MKTLRHIPSHPTPVRPSMSTIYNNIKAHRLVLAMLLWVAAAFPTAAQPTATPTDRTSDTHIGPAYFGPNAFPVPDMLDGTVSGELEVKLRGDWFRGDYGDHTGNIMASIRVPLFTPRANLVVWMPVVEGYHLSTRWMEHAGIDPATPRRGNAIGALFVSTDVLLMRETKRRPAMAIRAGLKTASEDDWTAARYYDCPGYFFDMAFGKDFAIETHTFKGLRVGVSGGFLCWQTDNARQNDATMYALKATARFRHIHISQDVRGYFGWEKNGDCPAVMKTTIEGRIKRITPFVEYQKGLHDYPFQQFALGLKANFDILSKQQRKKM